MQFVWRVNQDAQYLNLSDSVIDNEKLLTKFLMEGLQDLQVGSRH